MALKDQFCASPWLHMRVTNSGGMTYCRWADKTESIANIANTTPQEFFQQHMAPIRTGMLDARAPSGCKNCFQMEQHGKVSGRQKQLLKIGVQLEEFDKTLASSPWVPVFAANDQSQMPQDWQIDLGNYCNSACVFCIPESSSRLAAEHFKLNLIQKMPLPNWSDDPVLVKKLIDTLITSPHIQYIHFIGGETLITPAFKTIMQVLIDAGLHQKITLGLTTNLSVWRDDIVSMLESFYSVNLGMSVETLTPVNDYIRWPVTLATVMENLERWREVAAKHKWYLQLRTTPTLLSIMDLITVYDYAWSRGIAVESCNFLQKPEYMQVSVLPLQYREPIIDLMISWIQSHTADSETILNIRNPDFVQSQICQDLDSYVQYLKKEPDNSHRLPQLVQYLKKIQTLRGNNVLNYIPEYEELFRAAGY